VAGLTWILIEWIVLKQPTALGFATGAVAGLVAITPAAGFVGPMAAIALGVGVACLSYLAIKMKSRLGYDDTLDVFGVHCVGGIWGALATGLFAQKSINSLGADGLFFGGGVELLGKQAVGVIVALLMGAIGTFIIASILKAIMGIRAPENHEDAGLDLTEHGESGYAGPSAGGNSSSMGGASMGHGSAVSHAVAEA